MSTLLIDRVAETTATSGTGTFTLDGAVTAYQSFSDGVGVGNTCYYCCADLIDGDWEVGLGTVGSGTLARTTVLASSNSDALVDFSANDKQLFVTFPASKSVYYNAAGNTELSGDLSLTSTDAKIILGATTEGGDYGSLWYKEAVSGYDVLQLGAYANSAGGDTAGQSALIQLKTTDDESGSGSIHLFTGANYGTVTERMTVLSSGNITTIPSGNFTVFGANVATRFGGLGNMDSDIYKVTSGQLGATRRLNFGDVLFSKNLSGVSGADTYKTIGTYANVGYSGVELRYGGATYFYNGSGDTTADNVITPSLSMAISGSGYVGIGTSSPKYKLHVVEAGVTGEDSPWLPSPLPNRTLAVQGNGAAYVATRDVTNDVELIMGTSSVGATFIGSTTSHELQFRTAATTRAVLSSTGTFTLTSDNQKLALGAAGTSDSYLQFNGSDLEIYSARYARVTTDYRTGLEVGGGGAATLGISSYQPWGARIDTNSRYAGGWSQIDNTLPSWGLRLGATDDFFAVVRTGAGGAIASATDLLRITNAGKVGIGTASPNAKLTIAGANTTGIDIYSTDSNPTNAAYIDLLEKSTPANNFGEAGVYGFRMFYEGNLNKFAILSGSTTTTISRFSIERDTGLVWLPADNQKLALGAAGYSDSYLQYTGSALEISAAGGVALVRGHDNPLYGDCYTTTSGYTTGHYFRRSRNNTVGALTTTNSGDYLGVLYFQGVDSSNDWAFGAKIAVLQDGTAGTYVPTKLSLNTYSSTAENTNQLVLANTGYVGIGVASPSYKLELASTSGQVGLWINSATNDSFVRFDDAYIGWDYDVGVLKINGQSGLSAYNDLVVTSGGNVGIGTNSPARNLDIVSGSDYGQLLLTRTKTTGDQRVSIASQHYTNTEEPIFMIGGLAQSTTNRLFIGGATTVCNAATSIEFYTGTNSTTLAGTEWLRIDNAGTVWLKYDTQKLALGAAGTADSYLQFNGTNLQLFSANAIQFNNGITIANTGDSISIPTGAGTEISFSGTGGANITHSGGAMYLTGGSLNFQYAVSGNISCFVATTGNPQFQVVGYDSGAGATKYGYMTVDSGGAFNVGSQSGEICRLFANGSTGTGVYVDTSGAFVLPADNQKIAMGGSGITDSYIQYTGSGLSLYAAGNFAFTTNGSNNIVLNNSGTAETGMVFQDGGNNKWQIAKASTGGYVFFYSYVLGGSAFRVFETGNVALGFNTSSLISVAGDMTLPNDNKKISLGASGTSDSYLQYTGTELEVWTSLGEVVVTSTTSNPNVVIKGITSGVNYSAYLTLDRGWSNRNSLVAYATEGTNDWFAGMMYNAGSANYKYSIGENISLGTNTHFTIDTNGKVGLRTTTPGSQFHVYAGSSGITPHTYSLATLESNDFAGLNILTPSSKVGYIMFGDESDAYVGGIEYDHTTDTMTFQVADTDVLSLNTDGTNTTLTTSGDLVIDCQTVVVPKITIDNNALLGSPIAGTLEFNNDRLYVTNVATQRAIDRTSGIVTSVATVSDTTAESTIYTATLGADSLKVGNLIKLHASGVISNATASDDITLNVYLGATLLESFNPAILNVTNAHWEVDYYFSVHSDGTAGQIAEHGTVVIKDQTEETISIETVDTTTANDLTVKVQWDAAKAGNTISIYQGWSEFKN